jgi:hypothetical protein
MLEFEPLRVGAQTGNSLRLKLSTTWHITMRAGLIAKLAQCMLFLLDTILCTFAFQFSGLAFSRKHGQKLQGLEYRVPKRAR